MSLEDFKSSRLENEVRKNEQEIMAKAKAAREAKESKSLNETLKEMTENGTGDMEALVIGNPEVLGKTYEEIIENLNLMSDLNLPLVVRPLNTRS